MATSYHEPVSELSPAARDLHRALTSTVEELEAVDWYNQRADVCRDPDLAEILRHNRDEEIEHASMLLEWLRRQMPQLDRQLRTYLFTTTPIAGLEAGDEPASEATGDVVDEAGEPADLAAGDLGVRRGRTQAGS